MVLKYGCVYYVLEIGLIQVRSRQVGGKCCTNHSVGPPSAGLGFACLAASQPACMWEAFSNLFSGLHLVVLHLVV